MVERVVINEPTAGEIEPEEEVQEEVTEEESVEEVSEKPEWLPEKFSSPEDLAKAYSELESKLGSKEEETPETPQESLDVSKYAEEYADSGKLSEDSFKALESQGIPKDLVEKFIEGQAAMQKNQVNQIYSSVGGEERFEEIRQWASENLTQAEIDVIDKQLNDESFDNVTTAVKGLEARFNNANGYSPELIQGSTAGRAGAKPFESIGEYTEAMRVRDQSGRKKYEHDSAYRKQIENRLAVSTIL